MLHARLKSLLTAAGLSLVLAMGMAIAPAEAKTHVHVHIGIGVPGPYYWYGDPWWAWGGPVIYYPVPYYVPVYYSRPPRYTHRPRWRTRCWTKRRIVRRWNGHRWVKKVVRKRVCRRVRVW